MTLLNLKAQSPELRTDPWPRGVNYQIFVRSFSDGDKDGLGDLKGITAKLDYLKELGVNGIWITPVNKSPSYHKYDITDYLSIDPECGSMEDLKNLTKEVHKRGMHILMDLVVNHTSKLHPWFLSAAADTASPHRDYYLWSAAKKVAGSQNWWPLKENNKPNTQLYFGHFGSNMPDLNYDNVKVRQEIIKIGQYWIQETGIDGYRLDAAQHIYPDDAHDKSRKWWQEFRAAMEKQNKNFFMVGEVWNVDAIVAPYLKDGLHSVFNFDLAGTILKVVKNESDDSLVLKHQRTMALYNAMNPGYVDATFLSNHDQNRSGSELHENPEKIKLAAAILLTLPGTPYIYYGEELGMKGFRPDEYVREPFLWDDASKDINRTKWIQPKYNTDKKTASLKAQKSDSNSIFNHYKTLISLRNSNMILQLGTLAPIVFKTPGLLGYSRTLNGRTVYIVHNLTAKNVTFDLDILGLKTIDVLFENSKIKATAVTNKIVGANSSLIFQ